MDEAKVSKKGEIMSHAQSCPICFGKGKIKDPDYNPQLSGDPIMVTCHGCGGRGWVQVEDTYPPKNPYVNPHKDNS